MKDPNEKYWLFSVFTVWETRQHLSATTFPPFSNTDFLHLLLSVRLWRHKPDKLDETFFFFLYKMYTILSSLNLKGEECRAFQYSSALSRPSSSLFTLGLLTVIQRYCWIEMGCGGAFTPANRDVCTWPGGWGLVRWTVLLLPPQVDNKEVNFRQVNISTEPLLLYSDGLGPECWLDFHLT